MFGLKIFVRVQTFRQVPPVLPRNFCHPAVRGVRFLLTQWDAYVISILHCVLIIMSDSSTQTLEITSEETSWTMVKFQRLRFVVALPLLKSCKNVFLWWCCMLCFASFAIKYCSSLVYFSQFFRIPKTCLNITITKKESAIVNVAAVVEALP